MKIGGGALHFTCSTPPILAMEQTRNFSRRWEFDKACVCLWLHFQRMTPRAVQGLSEHYTLHLSERRDKETDFMAGIGSQRFA